jgi:hypothetical protein
MYMACITSDINALKFLLLFDFPNWVLLSVAKFLLNIAKEIDDVYVSVALASSLSTKNLDVSLEILKYLVPKEGIDSAKHTFNFQMRNGRTHGILDLLILYDASVKMYGVNQLTVVCIRHRMIPVFLAGSSK